MFEQIISAIDNAKNIVILYHVNADGDAIGSALALSFGIYQKNKLSKIFSEEAVQNQLSFLPDSERICVFQSDATNIDKYDLCILLDCGGLNRLGNRISIYNNSNVIINIDHHKSNEIPAQLSYVDTNISSCGEIIYELLKEMNIKFDEKIATCLYTAISTDTGNFKFSNTSSKTLKTASELVEFGASPSEISKSVYDNMPFSKLKLVGKVIETIEISNEKISTLYVDSNMITSLGASVDELDNVANYGLSIEGVELSLFFKEISNSRTKVSLRSKNYFDCSSLARDFGGGGHARAAGCEMNLSIKDCKELILKKIFDEGLLQ